MGGTDQTLRLMELSRLLAPVFITQHCMMSSLGYRLTKNKRKSTLPIHRQHLQITLPVSRNVERVEVFNRMSGEEKYLWTFEYIQVN